MRWIRVIFRSIQLMTTCLVIINCTSCSIGWFGHRCQYKCHCQDMNCSETGECIDTSCERGWFEYLCQYQNFMELPKTYVTGVPSDIRLDWLTDNSDSTCNYNQRLQSVTVTFESQLVFTWLHLTVKEGVNLIKETADSITLRFESAERIGTIFDCHNRKFFSTTKPGRFELGCDINEPVAKVILSGTQLNNLCAVQINGGRNVALKQNTSYDKLSNRVFPGTSQRAVDGNTSAIFDTCAKAVPFWTLTYKNDFIITRILLYNIRDFGYRTQYFELTGYGFGHEEDTLLFRNDYTIVKEPIVAVLNRDWKKPWRFLAIIAKSVFEAMMLCEVETFGDCPPKTGGLGCDSCEGRCIHGSCFKDGTCEVGCNGTAFPPLCLQGCGPNTWGLNCDKNCVGCYNASCDQLSGLCTHGCNGYSDPPDCTKECTPGTWGKDCNSSCSVHCNYASCNREKGFCDKGCAIGFYGDYCSFTCSVKCKDGECDRVHGYCLQCFPGYKGNFCDKGCIKGFYGDNCSLACPEKCKDGQCNRLNRTCLQCHPGGHGPYCDEAVTLYPEISARDKIAILCFVLGVGLICIVLPLCVKCICCMMRRKHKTKCSDNRQVADAQWVYNYPTSLQYQ